MYNRTVNKLSRTNNAIEGFHRGFDSILQANKPDVWRFFDAIHKQQALTEFATAQQMGGKNMYKAKDNYAQIKRIVCSAKDFNSPLDYLKAIASNMSF